MLSPAIYVVIYITSICDNKLHGRFYFFFSNQCAEARLGSVPKYSLVLNPIKILLTYGQRIGSDTPSSSMYNFT